jgi:hypothetical protein
MLSGFRRYETCIITLYIKKVDFINSRVCSILIIIIYINIIIIDVSPPDHSGSLFLGNKDKEIKSEENDKKKRMEVQRKVYINDH